MIINLASQIDNASVQVGDTAYYVNTEPLSGINNQQIGNDPVSVGIIQEIGSSFIKVSSDGVIPGGSFLMFSKDNRVNSSRLKGYYAEVSMRHTGSEAAELFAVSSEVAISSK